MYMYVRYVRSLAAVGGHFHGKGQKVKDIMHSSCRPLSRLFYVILFLKIDFL